MRDAIKAGVRARALTDSMSKTLKALNGSSPAPAGALAAPAPPNSAAPASPGARVPAYQLPPTQARLLSVRLPCMPMPKCGRLLSSAPPQPRRLHALRPSTVRLGRTLSASLS